MTEQEQSGKSRLLTEWQERYEAHLARQETIQTKQEQEEIPTEKPATLPSALGAFRASLKKPRKKPLISDDEVLGQGSELAAQEEVAIVRKSPIPRRVWLMASPVLLAAGLLLFLSLYFMSPLSKQKVVTVVGNQTVATTEVLSVARIPKEDYALTTWLHRKHIAKLIETSQDRIATAQVSFGFPNRFTIRVKEHAVIAHIKQGEQLFPLLANGVLSKTPLSAEQATTPAMIVNVQDKELLAKLVGQLAQVDSNLVQGIQTVDLQPSKVTADLLLIRMQDGHQVLVPLSEIGKKLPYYAKIAPQLTVASMVDMEVGVFSYPQ